MHWCWASNSPLPKQTCWFWGGKIAKIRCLGVSGEDRELVKGSNWSLLQLFEEARTCKHSLVSPHPFQLYWLWCWLRWQNGDGNADGKMTMAMVMIVITIKSNFRRNWLLSIQVVIGLLRWCISQPLIVTSLLKIVGEDISVKIAKNVTSSVSKQIIGKLQDRLKSWLLPGHVLVPFLLRLPGRQGSDEVKVEHNLQSIRQIHHI